MTTPLERVKELNYDHHRRMTELHNQFIAEGKSGERASVDDESYRTLLRGVPKNRAAILELGACSGAQWPLLREYLAPNGGISGIDLYEPLVRAAQHVGLSIALGFVEEMPYADDMFDLVCSRHVMEHLGDLQKGMQQILRVTQVGGYIAHVTPNMQFDNEPAHLNHLDVLGWSAAWQKAGLEIVAAERHSFNGGEVHIVGRRVV